MPRAPAARARPREMTPSRGSRTARPPRRPTAPPAAMGPPWPPAARPQAAQGSRRSSWPCPFLPQPVNRWPRPRLPGAPSRLRRWFLRVDGEELDLERQRRVRWDAGAAARPVGERRRDDELSLLADLHPGDALV